MPSKKTAFRVVAKGDGWAIDHNGTLEGDYATKEAAFEAIIGPASNSIKSGFGVSIEIDGPVGDDSALGAD